MHNELIPLVQPHNLQFIHCLSCKIRISWHFSICNALRFLLIAIEYRLHDLGIEEQDLSTLFEGLLVRRLVLAVP